MDGRADATADTERRRRPRVAVLTRRGWLLLLGALLLGLAGRLLGLVELFMLAAAAVAMVLGAAVYVRVTSFSLDAHRQLRHPRVAAGTDSRVELSVRNGATRRSPVIAASDPFDRGRRQAHFLLAPLLPGETAKAAYRLPTERRGVYDLGPLELHLNDPFGLARRSVTAAPVTTLTVFPRIDPIEAPALTRGDDAYASANHPTALAASGEDFYALREYEVGDDLRRVHWKSSAKLDQLMIRQDEVPWQGRAAVAVDLRPGVHRDDSLEMAVSAAASLVAACWRRRSVVRLVGTDGVDSGPGSSHAHLDAMLEHLAGVGTDDTLALSALLGRLNNENRGTALAVITTAAVSQADLDAVARLQSRFGSVILILIDLDEGAPRGAGAGAAGIPGLASIVRVTPETPFAAAWALAGAGGQPGRRQGARRVTRPAEPAR